MTEHPAILFVALPLAAYAVGSTPFGVIISRARGMDIRAHGSGNVGATNVGRVLGRKWGLLCFALDVLKGLLPVLIVGMLLRGLEGFPTEKHQAVWLGVGVGCILGHVFSFYLRFRGGKGVATSLGVVLGIFPYFTWAGLAAFALWVLVAGVTRYVSVASITAAAAFWPLFTCINWLALGMSPGRLWPLGAFGAAMALLIIYRHRGNISRLLAGTENKIGSKDCEAASGERA